MMLNVGLEFFIYFHILFNILENKNSEILRIRSKPINSRISPHQSCPISFASLLFVPSQAAEYMLEEPVNTISDVLTTHITIPSAHRGWTVGT